MNAAGLVALQALVSVIEKDKKFGIWFSSEEVISRLCGPRCGWHGQ